MNFPSDDFQQTHDSSELNSNAPPSVNEIQERLRRRYLDRLAIRVKRMRKMLLERDWQDLRNESRQLRESSESFGFAILTNLATTAENAIPNGSISRLKPLPEARQSVESLISAIDRILADNSSRFV